MKNDVRPFITAKNRMDILADLAREHSERVSNTVISVIERGLNPEIPKLDGKGGANDGGASGFWDKKDGKDGKDKEKDGKDSKEGKEGKDGKDSKDGKEGKEGKDSKDGKESKDSKEGKEGGKEDSKDGKDKDGKDKDGDGGKFAGSEQELYRYGDERILPVENFALINEIHSVRMTTLLNQPIF
jgi:hypothetical protein